MATVRVVDLIVRAQTILQDTTAVRWPLVELQNWLNDAYREIVNIRPDANTSTGTFACAPGTRQVLTSSFPNATRLIEVVRNLAAGSNRRAVRLVDRRMLDDQRRAWHAEGSVLSIEHYMFDPRVPKEFMVYPPATAAARLEVVYTSVPTAHTLTEAQLDDLTTAEVIRIDDTYANIILDYILFRAYTKDAEYAGNADRAMAHYRAVQAALGAKTQGEAASRPGAV